MVRKYIGILFMKLVLCLFLSIPSNNVYAQQNIIVDTTVTLCRSHLLPLDLNKSIHIAFAPGVGQWHDSLGNVISNVFVFDTSHTLNEYTFYYLATDNKSACISGTNNRYNLKVRLNDPNTIPSITHNGPLCAGNLAEFVISGKPGDSIHYSGDVSGQATLDVNGEYRVFIPSVNHTVALSIDTLWSPNACDSVLPLALTDSIQVHSLPSNLPLISSNSPVCRGNDAVFTISGTPGDIISFSGDTAGVATFNSSGMYTLVVPNAITDVSLSIDTIWNALGCDSVISIADTITVNSLPALTPTIVTNSPVCSGDQAVFTIQGTPGDLISYTGDATGLGTLNSSGTLDIIIPHALTDVHLVIDTVWNPSGCFTTVNVSDSIRVNNAPVAMPTISSNSPVCTGDDAIFTITGTPGDIISFCGDSVGTASIGTNGHLTLVFYHIVSDVIFTIDTVTSMTGCDTILSPGISDTVFLINNVPTIPALSVNGPVCMGDDAIFTISGTPGDLVSYSGDATGMGILNTGGTLDVIIPNIYSDVTITLDSVSSTIGCYSSLALAITDTVFVNSVLPHMPIIYNNSPVCAGDDAIFSIMGNPGDVVHYSGNASATDTIGASGILEVIINDVHNHVYFRIDEFRSVVNGCDTLLVDILDTVYVKECMDDFKLIEGFSPNGDGINDLLIFPGLEQYSNVELIVYNRWGTIVYRSLDYKNNWNGTSSATNSSNKLPVGTYYYKLKIKEIDKEYRSYLFISY